MLATRFPRPVGDIGNPASFRCPVLFETVAPASPERVVRGDPSALLPLFVAAGSRLVERGAALVTTSCGFLAPFQSALERALPVPVFTSALLAAQRMAAPAILTIDAGALTAAHLDAAGVPPGTPVAGVENTAFARAILGNAAELDTALAEREVVAAARRLVRRHPSTSDIVLECTNMGPYRAAVAAATERRAHSLVSLLEAEPVDEAAASRAVSLED